MRLLLAEDEKSLARAVSAILEKNNFSVDVVYDGADALDWLRAGNYDGAVLDIMMPKMDGITVLKTIRAEGNMLPVPERRRSSITETRCTAISIILKPAIPF